MFPVRVRVIVSVRVKVKVGVIWNKESVHLLKSRLALRKPCL